MANVDVNDDLDGDQFVYTYAIEVDPKTTGQGPNMTALMKSVATNGKGSYFSVSSGNSGSAIISALSEIFNEIQAVNSVFAATTLPVSVNVRGTNLNQVYVGVFRPDSARLPRWFGNLKAYSLGLDSTTDNLFLADSAGDAAENSVTGFIKSSATSYWTSNSSFWSFRTDSENGDGGDSDAPDGDLVEKGGVAQTIREDWPTSQATRNIFTCTNGGIEGDGTVHTRNCKTETSPPLSDYQFVDGNTSITSASLNLNTSSIDPLSAAIKQTATSVTDVRELSGLSAPAGSVSIDSLSNGATSKSVTITNQNATSISSLVNDSIVYTISSFFESPNNTANVIYTTPSGADPLQNGDTVVIAGASNNKYNGTKTIVYDSDTEFHYSANGIPNSGGNSGTATKSSTIVVATATAHGCESGGSITISGASPAAYNDTYTGITVLDDDRIQFITASPLGTATTPGTVTCSTKTATGSTSLAHGFADGSTVTVAGADIADYNGDVVISTTGPTSTTFTYTDPTAGALDPGFSALAAPGGTITVAQGSTTVVATIITGDLPPPMSVGDIVTISGSDIADYNGNFEVDAVGTSTFEFETLSVLPDNPTGTIIASGGSDTTAVAVLPDHGFTTGETIKIAGANEAGYNGDKVITVVDGDTFTYTLSAAENPATGTVTARPTSPTGLKAYVTLTSHGYGTLDSVTISGANEVPFNKALVSVTKITDDLFSYPISTAVDAAGTGTIIISEKSTTAIASSVNHGFSDNSDVTISGASPTAFNGTFTITKIDDNSFSYTLGSAQADATGTISATPVSAGSTTTERTNIINWIRGEDNIEDEDSDSSTTDIRSTVHGDVLHSRPAVVNYNRFGDDNDVYVFYGANDGVIRAVKGGFGNDISEPDPGTEVWGFVPEEFFGNLKRLRNNDPKISSNNKKPYFADGSIGVYYHDDDGNGKIETSGSDQVVVYFSMRRGGRFIYALDVTDPQAPKLLWTRSNYQNDDGTAGEDTKGAWAELGFTWSAPKIIEGLSLDTDGDGSTDFTGPLLFIGAGYDPTVEDVDPATITAWDTTAPSTTITTAAATYTRSMGRGMFVVDALTGNIIFQAGPSGSNPNLSTNNSENSSSATLHTYFTVSGMDYSVPSDLIVLPHKGSTSDSRAYFGDTGGNVWRLDFGESKVSDWKVTKLAAVADHSSLPGGIRKFMYPPEVVYNRVTGDNYDAVLLGSGDREHAFDTSVTNRFYMFKDKAIGQLATDASGAQLYSTLVESNLFDATTNCIQSATECSGSGDELNSATAITALNSSSGWYITMGTGEKVISNAVVLDGETFFNTNTPSSVAGTASCTSDLGVAKKYQVLYDDATVSTDVNLDGTIDAADRATVHAGGGYLPSPVPVVVEIDGKIKLGVISGVKVSDAPGTAFGARTRKFWFKDLD